VVFARRPWRHRLLRRWPFGLGLTHHQLHSQFIATADRSPSRRTRNADFHSVLLLRMGTNEETRKTNKTQPSALGARCNGAGDWELKETGIR
jgi:hypothetical protein